MPADAPFWKTKKPSQMTDAEWESLCDGCGKCCLSKYEDEETLEMFYTSLHCKLLDPKTCQCSDYANRRDFVPECVKITPAAIKKLDWMPDTCAYRLVSAGKDLPRWHHLVCGDREEVHRAGVSGRGRIHTEVGVDEQDAMDYLIDWYHKPKPLKPKRIRRPTKPKAP